MKKCVLILNGISVGTLEYDSDNSACKQMVEAFDTVGITMMDSDVLNVKQEEQKEIREIVDKQRCYT